MPIRLRPPVVSAIILMLAGAAALGADLGDSIASAIAAAKLGPARIGISVVDLSSGRTLAARDEAGLYIPASNMKLLTSGAALKVLGPDFVFRTEVRRDGDRLVIVGSGDPALADPELLGKLSPPMTVEDVLDRIVGAVKGTGPVMELVVDGRVFDGQFVHPGWPADQLNRWYCAEVAGINFHTNTLSVFPRPSREGVRRPPEVTIEPMAPWIDVDCGKAKTVETGTTAVFLTRAARANEFTLQGSVRNAVREPVQVTLHDAPVFFGQVLADRMARAGMSVGTVRRASEGELFGGRVVAVTTSHIDDILARCNTDSYNLYAEALMKRIGYEVSGEPGSWSNGAAVMRMTITQMVGAEVGSGAVISDGSGMTRENRVTPRLMTAWLRAMERDPGVGGAFVESLAALGEGPLKNRFGRRAPENQLRAKTGYIKGVRCLSGFLTSDKTGQRVAFSILVNELKGEHDAAGKRLQEALVLLIDDWLSERALERVGADSGR